MSKRNGKAWKIRESVIGPQGAGPCVQVVSYKMTPVEQVD